MNAPHHPNVERVLGKEKLPELMSYDDHDWKTARDAMAQRQNEAYERMKRQWWQPRNEGEANIQLDNGFRPIYNHPVPEPELLTPGRVLIGCGVFLAVCVAIAVAVLNFYR